MFLLKDIITSELRVKLLQKFGNITEYYFVPTVTFYVNNKSNINTIADYVLQNTFFKQPVHYVFDKKTNKWYDISKTAAYDLAKKIIDYLNTGITEQTCVVYAKDYYLNSVSIDGNIEDFYLEITDTNILVTFTLKQEYRTMYVPYKISVMIEKYNDTAEYYLKNMMKLYDSIKSINMKGEHFITPFSSFRTFILNNIIKNTTKYLEMSELLDNMYDDFVTYAKNTNKYTKVLAVNYTPIANTIDNISDFSIISDLVIDPAYDGYIYNNVMYIYEDGFELDLNKEYNIGNTIFKLSTIDLNILDPLELYTELNISAIESLYTNMYDVLVNNSAIYSYNSNYIDKEYIIKMKMYLSEIYSKQIPYIGSSSGSGSGNGSGSTNTNTSVAIIPEINYKIVTLTTNAKLARLNLTPGMLITSFQIAVTSPFNVNDVKLSLLDNVDLTLCDDNNDTLDSSIINNTNINYLYKVNTTNTYLAIDTTATAGNITIILQYTDSETTSDDSDNGGNDGGNDGSDTQYTTIYKISLDDIIANLKTKIIKEENLIK